MSSIITLKVIAVIGAEVPVKVTYTEESTSRRWGARYKIMSKFEKGSPENIREKISVLFMQHDMQQAINLDEEMDLILVIVTVKLGTSNIGWK